MGSIAWWLYGQILHPNYTRVSTGVVTLVTYSCVSVNLIVGSLVAQYFGSYVLFLAYTIICIIALLTQLFYWKFMLFFHWNLCENLCIFVNTYQLFWMGISKNFNLWNQYSLNHSNLILLNYLYSVLCNNERILDWKVSQIKKE